MNRICLLILGLIITTSGLVAQPTDYLAYYPFSGNANDESINALHGNVVGASLTADRFGNSNSAYAFDGNSYIDCGASTIFDLEKYPEYTISVWIKPDNTNLSVLQAILSRHIATEDRRFYLLFLDDNPATTLTFEAYHNGAYQTTDVVSTGYNTSWQHVLVIADDGKIKMYLDQVLVSQTSITATMKSGNSNTNFVIGAVHHSDALWDRKFTGIIDDVRIYNRALSNSERDELYEGDGVPSITTFTPTSGPIGTEVTITGTDFDATPANNIVFFGATQASVAAASANQLTVIVPSGATYEPITVLVDGLIAYSAAPFVVTFGGDGIDGNSFDAKKDFATGSSPYSVSAGDLDGDGKTDLVVANRESNTISVLRNTSTGAGAISYATKVDYTTGLEPWSIAIDDLDGDGKLDLAVINVLGESVSLFRNTSEGIGVINFDAKIDYTTGSSPVAISIGDLDSDGLADLAIANSSSSTVSIFKNTSTGSSTISFAAKVDYTTGINPYAVSVGDLDGDRKADLAIANYSSNTVSVLRNTSTGPGSINYATKVDFATEANPHSVSIGDFDGDGRADLGVVNSGNNTVSILRNTSPATGTVSYAAKIDYAIGLSARSISNGDINGDGKVDFVVVNEMGPSLSVFMNTSPDIGTISYNMKVDFATGGNPISVSICDLDNDDKPDLAVVNSNDNTISVLRNMVVSKLSNTATDVLAYSFAEQTGQATIDAVNHTIAIEVASGTDPTSLVATFTLSSGTTAKIDDTIQVSGTTANDFSSPLNYVVTSQDGSTSQVWNVNVTVDSHPVISNITAVDSYLIGSGGHAVSASVTDDSNISNVKIYSKKTSETDLTSKEMTLSGENYTYSFIDSDFGRLGLTFYIEATDSEGNKTTSVQYSVKTVKEGDIEAITELKSSNDQLDYAMIAIPYEVQGVASVFSNLGAHANNEWRLAHYNGGVGYQYYPVDFSNFEPGKGYWFLTSRPSDFSLKGGSAVEASDSEPFTIQLRANDWNMIGNPYPFAIDWQAVIDYNANNGRTVEKLVTYTNRQYNSDQTTLNKYGGALLHSSTAMEIQIPVSARRSSTGRIRQTQNRNNLQNFGLGPWVLGLGLKNESMVYQVSSISMKDGAETGIDSYDWKMLPRLSSYLDVSFGNELTKSVVPIADQFTWEFSVNSNLIGELTTLSWDNYGFESSDYGLMLLDVKDQRVVDMGKRNFHQFKIEETSRPFKLFYASKNRMIEYMNLESNFVGDPFPNPFNSILTIPISIHEANAKVQIHVYNVLGKKVYQSMINQMSSGYHEFNIDLTEGVNTDIKAGTYLMQVTLYTDSGIQLTNTRLLFSK